MKINIKSSILNLIVLLPLTTLFQAYFPAINRLILVGVIGLLALSFLKYRYKKAEICIIILFIISLIWAFFVTDGVADNTNEYFYLLFFILYALFIVKNNEYFFDYCRANTKYIATIVLVWNLCVFVSLFMPSSYNQGYFYSFTGNVFRSATAATFVLALVLVIVIQNKKIAIFSIMPLFCLFSGGSRTYLVVGLAIALLILYMIAPSKRFFKMSVIPIGFVVAFILFRSSIMDKIIGSMTIASNEYYQDPLVKFTSGRSLFWSADIKAFFDGSIINQIWGYGFNYVYEVNQEAIHNRIWAHNDYLNILLNYGYVGLISYIYMFARMFGTCVKKLGIPKSLKFLMLFIWMFNAFFNMFYTYTCACASYPFILMAVSIFWEEKIHRSKAKIKSVAI